MVEGVFGGMVGIYVLFRGAEAVYVGQSQGPHRRWSTHDHRARSDRMVVVAYVPQGVELEAEGVLIRMVLNSGARLLNQALPQGHEFRFGVRGWLGVRPGEDSPWRALWDWAPAENPLRHRPRLALPHPLDEKVVVQEVERVVHRVVEKRVEVQVPVPVEVVRHVGVPVRVEVPVEVVREVVIPPRNHGERLTLALDDHVESVLRNLEEGQERERRERERLRVEREVRPRREAFDASVGDGWTPGVEPLSPLERGEDWLKYDAIRPVGSLLDRVIERLRRGV